MVVKVPKANAGSAVERPIESGGLIFNPGEVRVGDVPGFSRIGGVAVKEKNPDSKDT